MEKGRRIYLMDALRGLAVLLMVVHHFLYDLAAFCGAPWWIFSNPLFDVLHYVFAGVFILLSGVSSNFSRIRLICTITVFSGEKDGSSQTLS